MICILFAYFSILNYYIISNNCIIYYKLRILTFLQNVLLANFLSSKQSRRISCGIVSGRSLQVTEEFYLHYWDGRKISQLDAFKLPKVCLEVAKKKKIRNTTAGMQIIGRGIQINFISSIVGYRILRLFMASYFAFFRMLFIFHRWRIQYKIEYI